MAQSVGDLANIIIGMYSQKMVSKKMTVKVLKNRFTGPPKPDVIERPDHFSLTADGLGMPTEHTAKVLEWLQKSNLKYFTDDSHFCEIHVIFFKQKDAAVFKLFWIK